MTRRPRRHYMKVPDNFADLPEAEQEQVVGALADTLYDKLTADQRRRDTRPDHPEPQP